MEAVVKDVMTVTAAAASRLQEEAIPWLSVTQRDVVADTEKDQPKGTLDETPAFLIWTCHVWGHWALACLCIYLIDKRKFLGVRKSGCPLEKRTIGREGMDEDQRTRTSTLRHR